MSMPVWLSTPVVYSSCALAGIVELRGIIFATAPPYVSMPRESGVTSRSSMLFTPRSRMLAWTAAPSATTSSGFNSVCGLRSKNSCTMRRTNGVRVVPPTSTTSSISAGLSRASASAFVRVDATVRQREAKHGCFCFRELMLHADQGFAKFLRQFTMRRKINFIVLQNLLVDKGLEQIINIVAAEVRVAVG